MKIVSLIIMWSLIALLPNIPNEITSINGLHNFINYKEFPEINIVKIAEEKIIGNEMGQVPILLYHRIFESDNMYDISANDFKKNIEYLYDNDFVLIDLVDYLSGIIDIPKGKHPIAITFDDGDITQFRLIENSDGSYIIDNQSAVGILYDFYLNHPDFGFEATFFLNGNIPFNQKQYTEYKLEFINEHGLRLGNHTLMHSNFSDMELADSVLNAVYDNEKYYFEKYDVELEKILALPFGIYPNDFTIIENLGYFTFKVGWKPEVSIFSKSFNPYRINRVQNGTEDFQFEYWITDLINNPDKVFTSDGNINTITVKSGLENQIDSNRFSKYKIIINEVE